MKTLFVKPLHGYKVYDPGKKKYLSEAGDWVPANSYWLGLKRERCVEEAAPPEAEAPKKASAKSTKRGAAAE